MTFIVLTHANYDTKITIDADQIFGVFDHPEFKATVVQGPGNAYFTVTETPEQVIKLKKEAAKND